ncbi:MAG: hypothetical protein KJ822_13570, partial [Proteobacteria bacterium]|nr:hypothetical protein [Pseudomonadota bacterium]
RYYLPWSRFDQTTSPSKHNLIGQKIILEIPPTKIQLRYTNHIRVFRLSEDNCLTWQVMRKLTESKWTGGSLPVLRERGGEILPRYSTIATSERQGNVSRHER